MNDNVISFPATSTMTVEMALESALQLAKEGKLRSVLIAGYDTEDNLLVRSSRMDRKEALWLSKQVEHYALFTD
jgi:hypothetical protein